MTRRKLTRKYLLERYTRAVINKSWIGATHPDEHDNTEAEYRQMRKIMRQIFETYVPKKLEIEFS